MSENMIVHSLNVHLEVTLKFMSYYIYVLFLSTTLLREIKLRQGRDRRKRKKERLREKQ